MPRIRILLIDDSAPFTRAACRFLRQQDALDLVGVGACAQDALDLTVRTSPDIVLLDLAMPGKTGLEAIPEIKGARPAVKVIALTLFDSSGYRRAAGEAGADGFVSKRTMAMDLMPAIERVAVGSAVPATGGSS